MNWKGIGQYFEKNGPSIATLASVVLTGLSVYFAIKKAPEGTGVLCEYDIEKDSLEDRPLADSKNTDLLALKLETGKKLAVAYKDSLLCAVGAMGCALLSNKLNGKKIAGLAAALALNEDRLRKVYSKAESVFGKGGKTDLKEMTDCDIPPFDPDEEPVKGRRKYRKEPIEQFYESYTGTLFESTGKDVDDAIKRATDKIRNDPRHMLNFNKWRSILGLEDIPAGTCVGWHRSDPFRPYTKLVVVDGREVIGIFYEVDPESGYDSRRYY